MAQGIYIVSVKTSQGTTATCKILVR
ncbi:MAG: hypothetical protein LBF55_03310 [Prevotellaceae bacterium]|nr:hypothetical protein [Prevotellaceae bacterium]